MNYRSFLTLLLLLVPVANPLFARENRIVTFGPVSGPHLVFTTPEESGQVLTGQLDALTDELRRNPPPIRVSIIVTANDFTSLPPDIGSGKPEGTATVVSLLAEEETATVILLLPGKGDDGAFRILNGSRGGTSPRWLLEAVAASLKRANDAFTLAEYRMPLYRIGWVEENPILGYYLRSGIPAIALEVGKDAIPFMNDLIRTFQVERSEYQDRHYLLNKTATGFILTSEKTLVVVMMVSSAVILMFLFIFSFLFGQKSEQHLRDLFHVWWLPFLYLIITAAALYAGGAIVSFLFNFRFGKFESWRLLPHLALAGKLTFAAFFITLVMSLNQLIRFPESGFIYGYIASIACMVNIFAFSSLDFSLSLLFLVVYLISFAVYHTQHPAAQAFGILCMIAPFYPYLAVLIRADANVLERLYSGADFWNVRMALFVMPIQLMISRFFHSFGAFGRRRDFYIPLNPVFAFLLAFSTTGMILFFPAWSEKRPLTVDLREKLDSSGFSSETRAAVKLGNMVMIEDPAMAQFPQLPADPASFVQVSSTSRKFIERRLSELSIDTAIPAGKIEVTISDPDNVAVFEASRPFELLDAGRQCRFTSTENPTTPLIISFSSARDAKLTAHIRVWTRVNPRGLSIKNPDVSTSYLFEIDRAYAFPDNGEE